MDPLTQGLLGANLSNSFSKNKQFKLAILCGFIGGLAADLDILIKSANDPLLTLEFHRQFTHSIFFIPIGGLIVTLFLHLFLKKKLSFRNNYIYSTLGYATHGFLDSFTTYGTILFWPLDYRIGANIISIIDPIYTSVLLVFLIISVIVKSKKLSRYAMIVSSFYLLFGLYQKNIAIFEAKKIAHNRGHKVEEVFVNPTIGNVVLWRSVYKHENEYYVDAHRVSPLAKNKFYEGTKTKVINISDYKSLGANKLKDIERFSKFSQGYIYKYSDNIISDLRYGTLPNDLNGLWGIDISNKEKLHVEFINLRKFSKDKIEELKKMVIEP